MTLDTSIQDTLIRANGLIVSNEGFGNLGVSGRPSSCARAASDELCDLGQVAQVSCASVFSPVKAGDDLAVRMKPEENARFLAQYFPWSR